jgi:hypothetical protein
MAKDKEVLFTVRALDPRDVYIERGLDGELLKVRVSAPPSSEGETEKRAPAKGPPPPTRIATRRAVLRLTPPHPSE